MAHDGGVVAGFYIGFGGGEQIGAAYPENVQVVCVVKALYILGIVLELEPPEPVDVGKIVTGLNDVGNNIVLDLVLADDAAAGACSLGGQLESGACKQGVELGFLGHAVESHYEILVFLIVNPICYAKAVHRVTGLDLDGEIVICGKSIGRYTAEYGTDYTNAQKSTENLLFHSNTPLYSFMSLIYHRKQVK